MFKLKQLTPLFFLLLNTVLTAQETFSSSGFNSNGNSGLISYSVGQVSVGFFTGNNGSLTHGVQQPYEIFSTLGDDILNINLKLTAYPNPTIDQLFNIDGKLLLIDKCENNKTHINLNEFPPNTYLLSISENNTVIKSFTIIKK